MNNNNRKEPAKCACAVPSDVLASVKWSASITLMLGLIIGYFFTKKVLGGWVLLISLLLLLNLDTYSHFGVIFIAIFPLVLTIFD